MCLLFGTFTKCVIYTDITCVVCNTCQEWSVLAADHGKSHLSQMIIISSRKTLLFCITFSREHLILLPEKAQCLQCHEENHFLTDVWYLSLTFKWLARQQHYNERSDPPIWRQMTQVVTDTGRVHWRVSASLSTQTSRALGLLWCTYIQYSTPYNKILLCYYWVCQSSFRMSWNYTFMVHNRREFSAMSTG